MATMLYALELPPIGGDTLFANQYMAYEQLTDGLKQTLARLKLISRSDNKGAAETRAARIKESGIKLNNDSLSGCHPAIRTHPETGRKSLYISPGHSGNFEGWSEVESAPLLSYLHSHQIAEEFRCRHAWQVGDLALWDNRCVLHYPVNDYHGHRRLLHRITLKGDIPV
jgi:taurine dioxygenase